MALLLVVYCVWRGCAERALLVASRVRGRLCAACAFGGVLWVRGGWCCAARAFGVGVGVRGSVVLRACLMVSCVCVGGAVVLRVHSCAFWAHGRQLP